ncbi:hypothetical protein D3C81_2314350 [compost metagenome]
MEVEAGSGGDNDDEVVHGLTLGNREVLGRISVAVRKLNQAERMLRRMARQVTAFPARSLMDR